MKKNFILIAIICSTAICSNIYAQATPPGSSDKDLRDTNIKGRSNELERIDRAAKEDVGKITDKSAKISATVNEQPEDKLAAKYGEIKTDYEQIQLSQADIIKTYQGSDKVDYAQIRKSAMAINKSAMRLHSNLFPAPITEKMDANKKNKTEKDAKSAKSIRDLIVDLDDSIGNFAMSPMFQNLRTIDAVISEKAQTDLDKIIELSAMLGAESVKKSAN